MSRPIRLAVVGGGAIAQVAHLPALTGLPDYEVVAICDNDYDKARSLANRFAVPEVFDDIEDLLRRIAPDAVAVCTPNHLHEIHAKTALRAGCHVLCERPLSLTVRGVSEVIAAQREADRAVMVGLQHRFRPDVQTLRQFLTGNELGTVYGVRCGWYTFRPARQALGWRRQRAQSGGGALLDQGFGLLDLALDLLDWPEPAWAMASLSPPGGGPDGVEDSASATIGLSTGTTIVVDVSWHYVGGAERLWFELLGTQGSARINPLAVYKELHGAPLKVTPSGVSGRKTAFSASYAAQWANFAAQIRGTIARSDLSEQLHVHRLLEAAYQSAAQGEPVRV